MSETISEFMFFKVKPTVKPEDPSNAEGEALLHALRTVFQQSGYKSSAWGRSTEDENTLVWVVGAFYLAYTFIVSKQTLGTPTSHSYADICIAHPPRKHYSPR
jgi:hypothetical protein